MPLSFGLRRVAPLLLEFARRYPEVALDMDFSDRRQNLIEEGIDLSIRITRQLAPARKACRLAAAACAWWRRRLIWRATVGRCDRPTCRITNISATPMPAAVRPSFLVDGQVAGVPVSQPPSGNNGGRYWSRRRRRAWA